MAEEQYESAPKLQQIPAATPASATFVINDEDHTLGNSLRYLLMRQPETQFCGYSVPHPSEALINVRLQTTGRPAVDVFREGLQGLIDVSSHIESTFIRACETAGVALSSDDLAGASPAVLAAAGAGAGDMDVVGPAGEGDATDEKGKKKRKGGK